jgi:hypothetical protein
LNAALLVPKENERPLVASLEERAHALGELGVYANFSGPWAPYRFIGDEV